MSVIDCFGESRKRGDEEDEQSQVISLPAIGNIDTSGISMLEDVKKTAKRIGLQIVLVNLGSEVMKKMNKVKKRGDEEDEQSQVISLPAIGNIDTSGISMLEDVKKTAKRIGLQIVLVNLGSEVMKKMNKAKLFCSVNTAFNFLFFGLENLLES
ncbi:sulfate transporter 3.1-like [Senna tora]|uniref:Sulfate transporter 3.1-like n=1 Tax=Senna tora TaxID=362788 RepID=A0A834ST03_9FABA|nr:sulfate transporter 3.1-like [Senna tora]